MYIYIDGASKNTKTEATPKTRKIKPGPKENADAKHLIA